jgi:hypothetical protein
MKELDDLLAALSAWVRWSQFDDPHAEITDDVIQAYRAFKAVEEPLVLEAVEADPGGMFYINWNGKSYRLPEGG